MAQEPLLQKLDEAVSRVKSLEREKSETAAKIEALEREVVQLRSLIALAESKADELMNGSVTDETAKTQPVNVTAESRSLEPSPMKGDPKMNIVEVEGLTKRFGSFTAADHVTFHVEKGEIFGLLGPNGAGKTTTMRMLCTLLRPTEGTARIAGFDIVKQAGRVREHVGLVGEKIILYDQLKAAENLILFGRLNHLSESELRERIDKWLVRLSMEQWRDKLVGSFSTGMKQRINIARALLHKPDVLILDEPTLGLDPQATRAIHEFISELSREGTTIVLTTHDMAEAESLCHRIAIIDQAKIVAVDNARSLKRLVSDGATSVINVEVPNLTEAMLSHLKSMQTVVSVAETDTYRLRIHTSGADVVGAVVAAIVTNGGHVRSINTVEPNLEDVFLHFTGREIRDAATRRIPSAGGAFWRRATTRVR